MNANGDHRASDAPSAPGDTYRASALDGGGETAVAGLRRRIRRIPVVGGLAAALRVRWHRQRWLYWRRLRKRLRRREACFGPETGHPRVLVIDHFFGQDIDALLAANVRSRIFVLPYQAIRELAGLHLPSRCQYLWRDYHDPALESERRAFRADLVRVVDLIAEAFPFDVVVTPSDLFFWIREFVPEVQARGIPVVVCDKEGTIAPHFFRSYGEHIRDVNPSLSDHLLVWSDRQKAFWQLAGVPESKVQVVGQPRSDFWSRPERWPDKRSLGLNLRAEAPLLLFFSFFPHAYIPLDVFQRGEVSWESLFQETHETILRTAERHPEWDVVVKTHPQAPNIPRVRRLIRRARLPNVHLGLGARSGNAWIAHADVISGFLTTALIEAMIVGRRPIVYAFWGDVKDKWSTEVIPFHDSGAVSVAGSPAEYADLLETAMETPERLVTAGQLEARARFVNEYFWNPDGRVGERTLAAIEAIVADVRSRSKGS